MQSFSFFHEPYIYIFLKVFTKQVQNVCFTLKSQFLYVYDHFCYFCLDSLWPVSLPSTAALEKGHSISA